MAAAGITMVDGITVFGDREASSEVRPSAIRASHALLVVGPNMHGMCARPPRGTSLPLLHVYRPAVFGLGFSHRTRAAMGLEVAVSGSSSYPASVALLVAPCQALDGF